MNNRKLLTILFVLSLLAVPPLACNKKDSAGPGKAPTGEVVGVPDKAKTGDHLQGRASVRADTYVVRSLVKEAPRSEMYSNGLFINLGSPDQTKYVVQARQNAWGKAGTDKETSYLEALRGATLRIFDWTGGIRTVVIRARAQEPEMRLGVELNDVNIDALPLKTQWDLYEFPLPKAPADGHMKLTLFPTKKGNKERLADIDWIWLRTKGEFPPAPAKVWTMSLDEPRRSLRADPPRAYSYYLQVPDAVTLGFGYGATADTRFTVNLHQDGAKPVKLFDQEFTGKKWQEAAVDLSSYAGEMVRLELVTSGKGKEREVEAGWAEPDLLRKGERPKLPSIPAEKQAKNVIYLLLDAARHDAFQAFNPHARFPTPGITTLAGGGMIFTNAYTPANWTLPSVVGLFTGRYPHSFGDMGEMFRLPKTVPVLAEHLKKQGFETAALVANPFISEPFGLKRGWDTFHNYSMEGNRSTMAEFLYQRVDEWLEKRKDKTKRFFLYVHAMDTHDPYTLHPHTAKHYEGKYQGQLKDIKLLNTDINNKNSDLYRKLNEADKRWFRAMYDGEVEFHDHNFKLLMENLEARKILDNTLIIYSSDHGEELWDHGGLDHGHAMYQEQIKTPLVLHYEPLFEPGSKVNDLVELLDITPTMLEVLGVPALPGTHGVSLRHLINKVQGQGAPYAIMSGNQLTVIVGRYKLFGSLDEGKLFDLKKDPAERKNLINTHHIAHRACEVYMGEGASVPNKRERLTSAGTDSKHKAEKVVLDAKLRKQLEALGYIE